MPTLLLPRPPAPRPVTDDATRRQVFQGAGAVGLAWLLTACGGSTPAGPDSAAGDTLTVTNQFGTFDVPRTPRRVLGWEGRRDLETTLALGFTPIAVGSNAVGDDGKPAPFVDIDLSSVQVIEQTEPDLELIASLAPDLILTRDSNIEELIDRLRPLAPLIPVTSGNGDPWRPELEAIAEALGRRDEVSGPLGAYDRRRSEVQEVHADRIAGAVLAVVQYSEGVFQSSATDGFYLQANTLADLGGTHLPFLEAGGEALTGEGFSTERTSELAGADAIVLISTDGERAELEASPLWQQLPAVAAGRVVETDFRTNYGSVYAAGACLDLLDRTYATLA